MKKFKSNLQEEQVSEDINISPLIDVVFILLIFFIVTMASADKYSLEVDVPEASNGQMPSSECANVFIASNGDIFVDNITCSISVLKERIKNSGKNEVLIYSDKSVRADKLVSVIDAIKASGNVSIFLATQNK